MSRRSLTNLITPNNLAKGLRNLLTSPIGNYIINSIYGTYNYLSSDSKKIYLYGFKRQRT